MITFFTTERRKKYEFQKRENPKANIPEPEPAVSNFEIFFLVHVLLIIWVFLFYF